MFKRFRDSVTGLFVSRKEATARPAETYASDALKVSDLQRLRSARLNSQRPGISAEERYFILDEAIARVLDPGDAS